MKILLDSNAWVWQLIHPERLSALARDLLQDVGNELLLSSVCVWEIGVKDRKKGFGFSRPFGEVVAAELASGRYTPLAVTHDHALQATRLPVHHRDPFDRLLIAQAQAERVPILTADTKFEQYGIEVIRADR